MNHHCERVWQSHERLGCLRSQPWSQRWSKSVSDNCLSICCVYILSLPHVHEVQSWLVSRLISGMLPNQIRIACHLQWVFLIPESVYNIDGLVNNACFISLLDTVYTYRPICLFCLCGNEMAGRCDPDIHSAYPMVHKRYHGIHSDVVILEPL